MAPDDRVVHQPLHPSLLTKLDPEYVAFHNAHLRYILPSQATAWDPAVRTNVLSNPFANTSTRAVEVGSIRDIPLKYAQLRVLTPDEDAPEKGWPIMLWFHGGAFAGLFFLNRD